MLVRSLLFLATLVAFAGPILCWVFSNPPYCPPNQSQRQTEANQANETKNGSTVAKIALPARVSVFPPHVQKRAEQQQSEGLENTYSNKVSSSFFSDSKRVACDTCDFMSRHWHQLSLTIFTALLAWFTFFLWDATRRMWEATRRAANAAKLSADAAVNVERPFVYVSDLELHRVTTPPQADGIERPDFYTMVFVFTNYGRTPAFVTRIGYGFAVGTEPPQTPQYQFVDDLTVEVVIKPGDPFRFDVPFVLMPVQPEQKKDFADGKIFPWLWGQIQFRDFLNEVGETGFIAFQYPKFRVGERVVNDAAFRIRRLPRYTFEKYSNQNSTSETS